MSKCPPGCMRTSPFGAFRTCRRVGPGGASESSSHTAKWPGALDLAGVTAGEVAHDVGAEASGDARRRLVSRRDQCFDAGERGDLGQHLRRERKCLREPVGKRALGNLGRNPRVACGGADDVPAGERGALYSHAAQQPPPGAEGHIGSWYNPSLGRALGNLGSLARGFELRATLLRLSTAPHRAPGRPCLPPRRWRRGERLA